MAVKKLSTDAEKKAAIAQRIALCVDGLGGQSKAARLIGLSQPGLRSWVQGEKLPQSIEALGKLADEAHVTVDWIIHGREGVHWLDRLDGGERIPVPQAFIEPRVRSLRDAVAYVVEGRELEPEIRLRDMLVIDRSQTDISRSDGRVFLFERDGRRLLSRAFAVSSTVVEVYTYEKKDRREKIAVADLPRLGVIGKAVLSLSEP